MNLRVFFYLQTNETTIMNKKILLWVLLPCWALGQTSLFNGKNLEGWQIHGTEKWYVDLGELVCESGPDAEYGY